MSRFVLRIGIFRQEWLINLSARGHIHRETTDYNAGCATEPERRRKKSHAGQLPLPHIPNKSEHNGRKPEERGKSSPCNISGRGPPEFSYWSSLLRCALL